MLSLYRETPLFLTMITAVAAQLSLSDVRIIGGDFVLKGARSQEDFASLTTVLRAGVRLLSVNPSHYHP